MYRIYFMIRYASASISALISSSQSAIACSVMVSSFCSSQPSCSAPRSITSREHPAAKPLLLYFFLRDLSSMSLVLLDGLMSAAAQMRPVSSSAAKRTFSISCSGATSRVVPQAMVMP